MSVQGDICTFFNDKAIFIRLFKAYIPYSFEEKEELLWQIRSSDAN